MTVFRALPRIPRPESRSGLHRTVDIAGLVKGASKGEGLATSFWGIFKDVDAIVHCRTVF